MTNAILKFLQVAKELGILELIPPFNFGGNKLQGVAAAVDSTDAVIKSQLDLKANLSETEWLQMVIDGDGSVLVQNAVGTIKAPYNLSIVGVTLISRESGATVAVDVLTGADYANLASLVNTGTKPALSNAQVAEKTTFTDWVSVNVDKDGFLQTKVSTASPTAVKYLRLFVKVARR